LRQQWRFVVNVGRELVQVRQGMEGHSMLTLLQAVQVETCLTPDSGCSVAASPWDETACRQKYTYRRLLAIGPGGEQYVDDFRFIVLRTPLLRQVPLRLCLLPQALLPAGPLPQLPGAGSLHSFHLTLKLCCRRRAPHCPRFMVENGYELSSEIDVPTQFLIFYLERRHVCSC
jgi:hypothetical protein